MECGLVINRDLNAAKNMIIRYNFINITMTCPTNKSQCRFIVLGLNPEAATRWLKKIHLGYILHRWKLNMQPVTKITTSYT